VQLPHIVCEDLLTRKVSRHRPERCLETSHGAPSGVWFGDIVPHVLWDSSGL